MLSQEEQLLTRFFETARLHDTTLLAKYATVTFNPRTEGVVQEFEVERVEPREGSKVVTVRAQVRDPSGQSVTRSFLVTMQQRDSVWMITGVRAAP